MDLEPTWSAMAMLAPRLKLHTLHVLDARCFCCGQQGRA